MTVSVRSARVLMGRLQRGDDLLEGLVALVRREGVRLGRLEALGAVETARLGYYDQTAHQHRYNEWSGGLEIVSLVGNVSLKEGSPVIHAHAVLAGPDGQAVGGHLAPGTRVFNCEFAVEVLEGGELHRGFDEATRLPLWAKPEAEDTAQCPKP